MALQPFNFYFVSGVGSITVNGSAPLSSYEESTPLSILATFSDGSTTVEWIVNNASEGTVNPLLINMPSGGIYLRIVGTGAPEVINQFQLSVTFRGGVLDLTVNGSARQLFYEAGTSLEILAIMQSGVAFTSFDINNGQFTGLTNPYTFTMPSQDVNIVVNTVGVYTPIDTYGLKYNGTFCDVTGQEISIEVLERDYSGYPELRKFANVSYKLGTFGGDVLEPILGSSVNFGIVGQNDEFFELLDGGNRKWMLRIYIGLDLFFEGYISNSFLTVDEVGSVDQVQSFTAVDGLKSLDALRAFSEAFTRIASGSVATETLARSLNQTFDVLRPMHIGCDIYETRMNTDVGVFEQFLVPDNAVYENGDAIKFIINGGGEVDKNTSLFIGELIRRVLKPFMCRVFLWKNEFYIVSTPELNKPLYTLFDYDVYGVLTGTQTVLEGLDLSCKFTGGQRTGKPVYTEFTVKTDLGVLDASAQGGLIEYSFGEEDWVLLGATNPYVGAYKLRNFSYKNAIPSERPGSYPTGTNPARVQYVSDGYCKIWGTTSNLGTADPDASWIEISTYSNKNPIQVSQGVANTLAFYIEFYCEPRSSDNPIPIQQFCGIKIQVGDYYMTWDGDQNFDWSLTDTVMEFPILNTRSWNVVDVYPLVIPQDGVVSVRLYEVVNKGSADNYTIGYRDMKVKIEQNEMFTQEAIFDKFITDTTYSQVLQDVEVYMGDVGTDNSASAIKLNIPEFGYPHSQMWTIDGVTGLKLSQIMLQEIANLQGRPNPRLIATALRDGLNPLEVVPYQNVFYGGSYWMVMAIDLDFGLNTWRIELQKLEDLVVS